MVLSFCFYNGCALPVASCSEALYKGISNKNDDLSNSKTKIANWGDMGIKNPNMEGKNKTQRWNHYLRRDGKKALDFQLLFEKYILCNRASLTFLMVHIIGRL